MKNLVLVLIGILIAGTVIIGQQEDDNTGQKIYDNTCSSCHDGGFKGWLVKAPKIGKLKAWEKYFENDLPTMVKHVNEGTKKHEVKGGCDDCTEEQIQAAIEYIVSETKQ